MKPAAHEMEKGLPVMAKSIMMQTLSGTNQKMTSASGFRRHQSAAWLGDSQKPGRANDKMRKRMGKPQQIVCSRTVCSRRTLARVTRCAMWRTTTEVHRKEDR